jgi:hypothetical protein
VGKKITLQVSIITFSNKKNTRKNKTKNQKSPDILPSKTKLLYPSSLKQLLRNETKDLRDTSRK